MTDVPITAYLFVGVFDVASAALTASHPVVARQLYVAGLWLMAGGVAVSLFAALTGWADWHRSSEPGTQARRTINAHAITMITATLLALCDLGLRGLAFSSATRPPAIIVVLSVAVATVVAFGATIGGSVVYDYGFNVETAGDHPAWHHNEVDVLPGRKATQPEAAELTGKGA